MPVELTHLTAAHFNALPRTQTVFFFPVSALEDHGPHLPMGLKLLEARKLCELAASRLEKELPGWVAVIMPEAPLGVDSITTQSAITVRSHVLRDWLIDSCRCLMKSGFIHFACFTGHLGPRQLTAIEEAGKMLLRGKMWLPWSLWSRGRNRPALVSASSPLVPAGEVRHSPLWPDPKEHGGARDTSVALHLAPGDVDPSYASLPARARTGTFWSRAWNHYRRKTSGYWGSPTDASSDAARGSGLSILEGNLDDVFPKLRAVWEGANPNQLFRSWYSIIPPNKGFFKVWVLGFALILMLWIWASLTVGELLP